MLFQNELDWCLQRPGELFKHDMYRWFPAAVAVGHDKLISSILKLICHVFFVT